MVGARVEHADIAVDSYDIFGVFDDSLLSHARLDNTDFLPAVNLTWNMTADTNIRGAYSSTLSRPDFRELSAQNMYDFVGGYPEVGNPNLKRARIRNLDFRVENYPGSNELLAASYFYKWLEDPIERSIQGGSVATYMPINAHSGYVTGIELESRLGLGRFSHNLNPFAFNVNYTMVKSETDVSGFGVESDSHRPLQGQANYLLNLGMFYASSTGATTGSMMFNFSGTRLASVGIFGLPDIYEQPRNSLDLVAGQTLGQFRAEARDRESVERRRPLRAEAGSCSRSGR